MINYSLSTLAECVMAIGSLTLATCSILAARRYRSETSWRAIVTMANLVNDFANDPAVRAVFSILEYPQRRILIPCERSVAGTIGVLPSAQFIAYSLVASAAPHSEIMSDEQYATRDCFDRFLWWMMHFSILCRERAITTKHILPYLRYWNRLCFEIVHNGRRPVLDYAEKYFDVAGTFMRELYEQKCYK